MSKLSQYELDREANIARNRQLFEQLELKQAVAQLGLPAKSHPPPKTKAKPVQSTKKAKREKGTVEEPRRHSARLRKTEVDPNESPSKKRKREAEIEERRAKEAEERLEAEERAWIAKRPRHHELDLSTLAEDEDVQEISSLSIALETVSQQPSPTRVAHSSAFDFDDDKKDRDAVAELREKLQAMKVVSRAKVTQDRVYSAAYHPDVTKDLIFFGDKHGQLGIWDARAPADEVADEDGDVITLDNREGGKYWRLQLHWPATSKSSISAVKFDPIDSNNVFTSSYDCTIRALSFTSGVSREIFSIEDTLISSIDLPPTGHEMWISDARGGVTHLDLRENKSRARRYELSDQKIGCISVNPTKPTFLLTASNNRFLKIWDARKLQNIGLGIADATLPTPPPSSPAAGQDSYTDGPIPVEFDSDAVKEFLGTKKGKGCLRGEWAHNKSVSSAYWDPRGRGIVSTSYDDTLRLWDIDPAKLESSAPLLSSRPFSHIRHNCQTGKWLTILKAKWSPNPDVYPHFTIGNMNHSLDIISCKGDLIAQLSDHKLITAVQAVTCSHPNILERAASGNASGRCMLWAPPEILE